MTDKKKSVIIAAMLPIIFLIGGFFLFKSIAKDAARPYLVVGVSPDYPQFEFTKNHRLVGFDVDLIKRVVHNIGYNIRIEQMSFSSLIPSLESGEVDMIISSLSETPKRSRHIKFSDPYFTTAFSVITKEEFGVGSLEGLPKNTRVGVQTDSTMEDFINQFKEANQSSMEIVAADSNLVLIEKLELGEIDAVIVENPQAKSFTKDAKKLTYFDIKEDVVGHVKQSYAIGMRKDSDLVDDVNRELINLNDKGEIPKLIKAWRLK